MGTTTTRAKITKLSAAHKARMAEWMEKWIRIGLCTDPMDFERAVDGIRRCYRVSGFAEPGRIIRVGSPIVAAICGPLVEQILVHRQWPACLPRPKGLRLIDGVWSGVRSGVWSGVESGVGSGVESGVESGVGSGVWSGVRSGVESGVESGVGSGVGSPIIGWDAYLGGQFWAAWQSFQSFLREVVGLQLDPKLEEGAAAYQQVAESANWWWPGTHVCYVSDRPEQIHTARQGGINRLHNDTGPSIRFRDGWSLYHINGLQLDEQIVVRPETQTIDQIDKDENNDRRAVRMQRFGIARYLTETGARVVDEARNDIEGTHESLLRTKKGEVFMWPTCPSGRVCPPLRVPREIETCEQARTWLAGERPFRVLART